MKIYVALCETSGYPDEKMVQMVSLCATCHIRTNLTVLQEWSDRPRGVARPPGKH